jgi:hypothetical protein
MAACMADRRARTSVPTSQKRRKGRGPGTTSLHATASRTGPYSDSHFFTPLTSMALMFSNSASEFKYSLFGAVAMVSAISLAASIFRNAMKAGLFCIACPISFAASASPLARTMVDFLSCSARVTMKRARSASC